FIAKPGEYLEFIRRLRAERGVSAFACDHVPTAIGRQQRRHAQPGAGTEPDLDALAYCVGFAQRPRLRRAEMRQGPGNGFEIIEHLQVGQTEPLGEFVAPEPPIRAIGQRDLLAIDRAGNGQRCRLRVCPSLLEVARDCRVQIGSRIVLHHQHPLDRAGRVGKRKPALTAADVAEERGAHEWATPTDNHVLADRHPQVRIVFPSLRLFNTIAAGRARARQGTTGSDWSRSGRLDKTPSPGTFARFPTPPPNQNPPAPASTLPPPPPNPPPPRPLP